jgi:hypothetical protein
LAFIARISTMCVLFARILTAALTQAIPFLGAVDFLETTARTLDKCVDQLRGLELEAYSGDYAL